MIYRASNLESARESEGIVKVWWAGAASNGAGGISSWRHEMEMTAECANALARALVIALDVKGEKNG